LLTFIYRITNDHYKEVSARIRAPLCYILVNTCCQKLRPALNHCCMETWKHYYSPGKYRKK